MKSNSTQHPAVNGTRSGKKMHLAISGAKVGNRCSSHSGTPNTVSKAPWGNAAQGAYVAVGLHRRFGSARDDPIAVNHQVAIDQDVLHRCSFTRRFELRDLLAGIAGQPKLRELRPLN